MSTINTHYTLNYSQPDSYRLSHDSVFLARDVYEKTVEFDFTDKVVLDVCAGSGVIGLDFLFHRRTQALSLPSRIDFLEVQNIYLEHFEENCKRFGNVNTELKFLNCNYNELQAAHFEKKYDLILGNPPYFLTSQGKLSSDDFKNRCRFYIDSDIENLILSVANSLKNRGQAYLLFRDQSDHKIDIEQNLKKYCDSQLIYKIVGNIRGTLLFYFEKKSQQKS